MILAMQPAELLAWWNLIFIVPFGLALVYLGLFVFTGITFGDTDVDADVDADLDADADLDGDADMDADHDVDGDHDAGDHDAGHDADHDADTNLLAAFLGMLGVGKVPLSLGLMILLLLWGLIGFALNVVLSETLGPSALVPAISLPVTFLLSMALTGLCAAAIARVVPLNDEAPARRQDLVGRIAEALYDIDDSFGMAVVRNSAGDLLQVSCKTHPGQRIAKGSRVVLFAYDKEQSLFTAAPFTTEPYSPAAMPSSAAPHTPPNEYQPE
jgi:membrane protein implicated in regulation of membrane protease activity